MATSEPTDTPTVDAVVPKAPPSQTMLAPLWSQALQNYQRRTGLDPQTHPFTQSLANCDSLDEVLQLFDAKMKEFKRFRSGDPKWERFRSVYLKPAVEVLIKLNDSLKEVSSSFVRLHSITSERPVLMPEPALAGWKRDLCRLRRVTHGT